MGEASELGCAVKRKASPRRQHRQGADDPAAIAKRDCGHRTPIRSLWSVEAEWPDGTIERVKTFKAELAALDWLSWQSHAWLEWRGTDFGDAR
jgi:hypothetical protein